MTALRHSCAEFCRNLQFCDLQKNHTNLRICDLRTGTPKKLADLRLRNEPKNLRICGPSKKFTCPMPTSKIRGYENIFFVCVYRKTSLRKKTKMQDYLQSSFISYCIKL
jgi:hypothetical protein